MNRGFVASALVAMAGFTSPLAAQGRYLSAIEYSVGIPLGDTRKYANGSWSGAVWESRWVERPHTSLGVLAGFNEFYSRDAGTFTFPDGAATGDRYRHLLTVPVLFTGAWYFNDNKEDPRWYIGGGGGVEYTEQIFQLGLNGQNHSNWGIVLVPEVGLAFSAWYGTGGIVALRYHLPTTSGDFFGVNNPRFQYFSLSMGIGIRYP
jgi:hypothetical protein